MDMLRAAYFVVHGVKSTSVGDATFITASPEKDEDDQAVV